MRNSSTCSSRSLAVTLSCDFDRPVIPSVWTNVHPMGGQPRQVALRDHRVQGLLGTLKTLQQSLGEAGALAQLRDRHIQGADAGVEVAVAITVTGVEPLFGTNAVLRPAHRVGVAGNSVLMKDCINTRSQSGLAWATGSKAALLGARGQVVTSRARTRSSNCRPGGEILLADRCSRSVPTRQIETRL